MRKLHERVLVQLCCNCVRFAITLRRAIYYVFTLLDWLSLSKRKHSSYLFKLTKKPTRGGLQS